MSVDKICTECGCEEKVSEGVFLENNCSFICGGCAYQGGEGKWDVEWINGQPIWFKKEDKVKMTDDEFKNHIIANYNNLTII
jgi:hypothetical protein